MIALRMTGVGLVRDGTVILDGVDWTVRARRALDRPRRERVGQDVAAADRIAVPASVDREGRGARPDARPRRRSHPPSQHRDGVVLVRRSPATDDLRARRRDDGRARRARAVVARVHRSGPGACTRTARSVRLRRARRPSLRHAVVRRTATSPAGTDADDGSGTAPPRRAHRRARSGRSRGSRRAGSRDWPPTPPHRPPSS